MISFYKLKKYKFLDILKKEFKNPKKETNDIHVVLKIDEDKYNDVMNKSYNHYLEILKDIHIFVGKDFYFQKYPNFRYNQSGDKYPVWHSDRHFNHHPSEINVMMPITKEDFGFEIVTKGSFLFNWLPFKFLNTKLLKFILGKLSKKIDYLDSILIFDGHHLHTASDRRNYRNPRLSIDFRLLPVNHKKVYKNSLRNIPIKPGYYFSDKPISHYV